MTLLPRTLWGRVLLIVLVGLCVAHAASFLAASLERNWTVQRWQARGIGERIAQLMRSKDAAADAEGVQFELPIPPPPEAAPGRARKGMAFARMALGPPMSWRVMGTLEPPGAGESEAPARVEREIRETLKAALGSDPVMRVTSREIQGPGPGGPGFKVGRMGTGPDGPRLTLGGRDVFEMREMRRVTVALRLPDARYALAESEMFAGSLSLPTRSWVSVLIIFGLTAAFSIWAARLAVRPVRTLAEAAERLSRNLDEPPLPEKGAREIRDAAHAFNRMQERLRRHVKTRALAFAAMSHDMRTPLTRMHLRLESIDEPGQKEKLRQELMEIEALAKAALEVTRGLSEDEPTAEVDLAGMAHAVAQDFATLGYRVELKARPVKVRAKPRALRRALSNLVDNAVKYGKEVELETFEDGIAVRDRGPGIPADELDKVVAPYYRLETSRSRETGGAGLGLAIAKDTLESQGAELQLRNRAGGGLEAIVAWQRRS